MGLEIVLGGFLELGRARTAPQDASCRPVRSPGTPTTTSSRHGSSWSSSCGMHDGDDDVLQNVGGLPIAAVGTRVVGVGECRPSRRWWLASGVRALFGCRRCGNSRRLRRFRSGQRLDVPGLAGRRLARRCPRRSPSEPGTPRIRKPPIGPAMACTGTYFRSRRLEDALVCAALVHVRLDEALLVEGERVGVLHDELAAADQAGARAELVAVLGLDLVERDRQVLVRGVHILDQQREHFLMRGGEQVVGLVTVLQTEQMFSPYSSQRWVASYGSRGSSAGEVDLLGADARRSPRGRWPRSCSGPSDPAAARSRCPERPCAGSRRAAAASSDIDVGIGGVLAQGAQEHGRHTKCFGTHTFQITQVSRLGCATRPRIGNTNTRKTAYLPRVINKSKAVSMILESASISLHKDKDAACVTSPRTCCDLANELELESGIICYFVCRGAV